MGGDTRSLDSGSVMPGAEEIRVHAWALEMGLLRAHIFDKLARLMPKSRPSMAVHAPH